MPADAAFLQIQAWSDIHSTGNLFSLFRFIIESDNPDDLFLHLPRYVAYRTSLFLGEHSRFLYGLTDTVWSPILLTRDADHPTYR